jgi:hypothetical protein
MRVNDKREAARMLGKNKVLMFAAMRKAGAVYAIAQFNGWGDSGQIDGVTCFDKAGDPVDVSRILVDGARVVKYTGWDGQEYVEFEDETPMLDRLIDEFCYQHLEREHGGWEINEGSFGDFRLDSDSENVSLEFNNRFETYDTSHEEF